MVPDRQPQTTTRAPAGAFALAVVAGLAALGGTAGAAELVMRDIGVGLELPPAGFTYDLSSSGGDRSGSDSFSSPFGIDLHGRYSLARTGDAVGVVLGAGLAGERASYTTGGTWAAYSVRGTAGGGWAATDRLTLLAEALVGVGIASLDLDSTSTFSAVSVKGPALTIGVQASAHFALSESLVLAGGVGWRRTDAPMTGGGTDAHLVLSGVGAFLALDWRLSDRPFLLE